ncbi:HAD family hydrolase [Rhodovulum adriaticum]|uniref:phosphoglycolate phosphatase n=1 Tax=Rhodovulum adriaticum TaxID=35804 RepID=A0A4R2NJK5_RHOAD|nr:HAD family hydrolase [Rhodovulum adriaticum]MBK1635873.1 phosphatase [Rhodovulum adriaticum]TCP21415.1 phosphoglycolate phosphatase [Rhodovulum adriaticum]
MGRLTAILFDKDGTLFDFHATWGGWAADFLTELTDGAPDAMARLGAAIGFDPATTRFDPHSPVIAGTPDEVAALMLPHLPQMTPRALLTRMNAAAARAPLCPAVPLPPLMADLAARGLALGVATNDAEAPARAHLSAAGVLERFDFIAGCDSGFGAKPEPGQLLAFAGAVGCAPDQVAMIGDSRHDLHAGRAAGMTTIGVLTGPARAQDLADLADAILPDIGHLPDYLSADAG